MLPRDSAMSFLNRRGRYARVRGRYIDAYPGGRT